MKKKADLRHKYIAEEMEGRRSLPGDVCPYAHAEIGRYCAWIAGHRDANALYYARTA